MANVNPLQVPNVQQVQQMQGQKAISGVQSGLKLMECDGVNIPITLNEGIADLKWLLNALSTGQFTINMDPQGLVNRQSVAAPPLRTAPRPLKEYEGEGQGDEA